MAITLGIWALNVLLVYGRVGIGGRVPLTLIWPRVGTVTLASVAVCAPFFLILRRLDIGSPLRLASAVATIAIIGGLFGGGTVVLYSLATNDTAYSLATQFASAAIYSMWIYLGWSLAIVILLNHKVALGPAAQSEAAPEVEFWVARNRHRERVRASEVFWFEAAGDYIILHTTDRSHMLHESLSGLTRRLDPGQFMRVHRSAIVNRAMVDGLKRNAAGDYALQLRDGSSVKVGRSYKTLVRSALRLAAIA